jgi:hypothetical protein
MLVIASVSVCALENFRTIPELRNIILNRTNVQSVFL